MNRTFARPSVIALLFLPLTIACDDKDPGEVVDETPDTPEESTWYADSDGDGYGDPDVYTESVEQLDGHVADNTDCNDADSSQYPGADELCNGEDDDCDKSIDEDATDVSIWYADSDTDGYGDPESTTEACDQPTGHVADDTDCDDTDPDINPDAEDVADGIDQDCDDEDGYIFSEDFESYAVGDYIGLNSYYFGTWTTGAEGGTEDVLVTDEQTYSTGDRALVFDEDGGDDLVLLLGPPDGSWLIRWYMYVETGAYFNLQGLNLPFGDWQKEVHIDENGNVYDDNSSAGVEVSVQQWVLVEYYVDLDAGTQDLYIDSKLILSDTFSGKLLGGIDFYPTPSPDTTIEDSIVFYVDEVDFSMVGK